jgi:hypothetical protein
MLIDGDFRAIGSAKARYQDGFGVHLHTNAKRVSLKKTIFL